MGNHPSTQENHQVKHFSKRLQKKFHLAEDEILVDSFLCALISKILVQGELYITPSKLIFHSPFNGRTLFGETILIMEHPNIAYIEKTHGVFGLQNSIYIETHTEEYTFTSFLFRDQAYNILNNTWTNYLDSIAHTLKFKDSIIKSATPRKAPQSFIEDEGFSDAAGGPQSFIGDHEKSPAELLGRRRRKVLESMPKLESFKVSGYKLTINDTDTQQFFNVVLSDNTMSHNGKEYSCWWQLLADRTGAPEPVSISQWEPRPPKNLRSTKSLMNYEAPFSKRLIKGKKPLKGGGWFTPAFIEYEEEQKLYVLDQKEIVVISEVRFLSKFPFSDTFEYLNCFLIKENDQNEVTLEYRYTMNFVKYCFFQGMIERQTQEEQVNNGNSIGKLLNEFKAESKFTVPPKELLPLDSRSDSWEEARNEALEKTKEAPPQTPQENLAALAPTTVEVSLN
jgi:hypothetical protein